MRKYETPEMEVTLFGKVCTIGDSMLENIGGEGNGNEDNGDF